MQTARTAIGDLPFEAMGPTCLHEHVHIGMPGWQFDPKAPPYVRSELISRAVDKLQELQAFGCSTIVDPCPMDLSRDPLFVAEVAQRSGTNIIVATGVYTEMDGMPSTFRFLPDEDILELYLREITEGIGDTGIRAGVVKIASGPERDNPYEARMIAIGTQAAKMTGVPLISHTNMATHGHTQIDHVETAGGRADCMVTGHSGDRDDPVYQASLAERGTFVGLDRFGLENTTLSDDLRIANLMQLVAAGHIERLVVSHDHTMCMLGSLGPKWEVLEPNWKLTRIFDYVIPQLKKLGLTQAQIDTIITDNPRSLFENARAQAAS